MADAHKNFAYSTVAAAPSPATSGVNLTVQAGDGTAFPAPPFNAVVWPTGAQPTRANAEIVRVTAIAGDVLTFTRGPQAADPGGINRTIVIGDQIMAGPTVKTFTDIENTQTGIVARMYRTAAFDSGTVTFHKIPLDTVSYDTAGACSLPNSRFVAPVAGYYSITGEVYSYASTVVAAFLYKVTTGGVASQWAEGTSGLLSGGSSATVSDVIYLAAGEGVELWAYVGTANATMATGAGYNYLAVALLAPTAPPAYTTEIRGKVNADGTVAIGAGFTSTKLGTAWYRVTFTKPFPVPPIVMITPVSVTGSFAPKLAADPTAASFEAYIGSGASDCGFEFSAQITPVPGAPGPAGASGVSSAMQPGATAAGDAAVTVNSTSQITVAGAGQFFVTSAAGVLVPVTIAPTVLGGIAAAATYTRLDQIVVDSSGIVTLLAGVESNGVTLANRTGAAAVPAGSRLLHDVLVTTGGVLVANVRDRRPWARGAYHRAVRTTNAGGTNDYTTASTSLVAIDTTNLQARIECAGVPVRVTLRGRWTFPGSGGEAACQVDGAYPDAASSDGFYGTAGTSEQPLAFSWDFVPSAGSHLFTPVFRVVGSQTGVIMVRSTIPLLFTVEELIRAVANNGAS